MNDFYLFILILFLAGFLIEIFLLNRALNKIPIRILVNGTRGKSTTVRLLYESFRTNGKTVFAKTTGDDPEILYPDGTVKTLKRYAPPSIIENVRILRRAACQKSDVFIMECMALQPEIQHFLACQIFKPHYTVITNLLPDHAEVMGPSLLSVAQVIGQCLHPKTIVILKEDDFNLFREAGIETSQHQLIDDSALPVSYKNIPDSVIKESWNSLQSATEVFGIKKTLSTSVFKEIWQKRDSKICLSLKELKTTVFNLFSLNDAESTDKFLTMLHNDNAEIFILNCRKDRPLRTKSFVELFSEKYFDVPVWLTGDGAYLAKTLLAKNKYPKNRISIHSSKKIIDLIRTGYTEATSVFCLGNHRGTDLIVKELQNLHNSNLMGA